MTEHGRFRIGFRGFHKDDVLQYIDELKMLQVHQLRELDARCATAENQIAAAAEQAQAAREDLEKAQEESAALREQSVKLTALAKAYKQEILRLREQAEQAKAITANDASELEEANRRIQELTAQNALLAEQNEKYREVVGDVNSVVVEARVLSESCFENAHQRSVDTISRLDTFLDDLKTQTKQSRFLADVQKQKGEGRIETLLSDIKRREEEFGTEAE